jgi:hypothetical protein
VAHYWGLMVGQGLVQGLEGSASQVNSAAAKMAGYVQTAFSTGSVTFGKASWLLNWIQWDNSRLQGLANRRAQIAATIKAADAYAAQVTSSTESAFSLSGAATQIGPAAPVAINSFGGILGNLMGDVYTIRKFSANIAKLRKMGLNRAYIDQLIQAGPVQGGPIAEELAGASKGQIGQVNWAESQIHAASVGLGQTAANAMFDSGKQAGKGFLSGLQAQENQINALMQRIARNMVNTLRRELGIRSPSSVMRDHGLMAGEGFALGLTDSMWRVATSAQRLSRAATIGAGTGQVALAGAGGGGRLQIEWVNGGGADQEFITWLKKHIRIKGGDPNVLGR